MCDNVIQNLWFKPVFRWETLKTIVTYQIFSREAEKQSRAIKNTAVSAQICRKRSWGCIGDVATQRKASNKYDLTQSSANDGCKILITC